MKNKRKKQDNSTRDTSHEFTLYGCNEFYNIISENKTHGESLPSFLLMPYKLNETDSNRQYLSEYFHSIRNIIMNHFTRTYFDGLIEQNLKPSSDVVGSQIEAVLPLIKDKVAKLKTSLNCKTSLNRDDWISLVHSCIEEEYQNIIASYSDESTIKSQWRAAITFFLEDYSEAYIHKYLATEVKSLKENLQTESPTEKAFIVNSPSFLLCLLFLEDKERREAAKSKTEEENNGKSEDKRGKELLKPSIRTLAESFREYVRHGYLDKHINLLSSNADAAFKRQSLLAFIKKIESIKDKNSIIASFRKYVSMFFETDIEWLCKHGPDKKELYFFTLKFSSQLT